MPRRPHTARQPRYSESVRKALTLNHHVPGVTLIVDLKCMTLNSILILSHDACTWTLT